MEENQRCNFTWFNMTGKRVICTGTVGHNNRHVSGRAWVLVGAESAASGAGWMAVGHENPKGLPTECIRCGENLGVLSIEQTLQAMQFHGKGKCETPTATLMLSNPRSS